MKKLQIATLFIVCLIFNICFNVFAETIILESGRVIEADIIDMTSESIKVDIRGATRDYNLSIIRSIDGEKINISSKSLPKEIVKTEKSEEKVNSKTKQTAVEKIQSLLEEKQKELSNKRKEYVQAKIDLKNAAQSGFFGFGRSRAEVQKIVKAKEKVIETKKEYIDIKKEINQLKKDLLRE